MLELFHMQAMYPDATLMKAKNPFDVIQGKPRKVPRTKFGVGGFPCVDASALSMNQDLECIYTKAPLSKISAVFHAILQ